MFAVHIKAALGRTGDEGRGHLINKVLVTRLLKDKVWLFEARGD